MEEHTAEIKRYIFRSARTSCTTFGWSRLSVIVVVVVVVVVIWRDRPLANDYPEDLASCK